MDHDIHRSHIRRHSLRIHSDILRPFDRQIPDIQLSKIQTYSAYIIYQAATTFHQ